LKEFDRITHTEASRIWRIWRARFRALCTGSHRFSRPSLLWCRFLVSELGTPIWWRSVPTGGTHPFPLL